MGPDFKQETREDRLLRLVKNLTTSTSEATLDEQSALKTLVWLTTLDFFMFCHPDLSFQVRHSTIAFRTR